MKLIGNMADVDRRATNEHSIPGLVLMAQAGQQVANAVLDCIKNDADALQDVPRVVIVCGPGNNGGDGFVCARLLAEQKIVDQKINVTVIATTDQYQGDAAAHFKRLTQEHCDVPVLQFKDDPDSAFQQIEKAMVVVDALFGSGLSRPITGNLAELINTMNASQKIVAVDVPSGINAATGQVLGAAVKATFTVTFQTGKPGLYLQPGKAYAGQVRVVDIGIPQVLIDEDDSRLFLITPKQAAAWLPSRSAEGHKYTFGNALVLAGSKEMPGAAGLVSEAVLSAGAGLVTLMAPEAVLNAGVVLPEVIRHTLPDDERTWLSAFERHITTQEKPYKALAIGPGMGSTKPVQAFFTAWLQWVLEKTDCPVVIDADGLNCLAAMDLVMLSDRFMLTPHLGEAKRLLGDDQYDDDLLAMARALQKKYGCQIVLKSASTVIATTDQTIWISPTGNSGMATAGSGDVLTGIITGLLVQGVPPVQVAPLGVYLHGLAGDLAAAELTEYALRAGHIGQFLAPAFTQLAQDPALCGIQ